MSRPVQTNHRDATVVCSSEHDVRRYMETPHRCIGESLKKRRKNSTKAQRTSSPSTPAPAGVTAKEESYFAGLKEQIELLKVLALATGMCTAAHVVLESELGAATRIVGAMTCLVLGTWIGICGVIVCFRHRLKLSGLPMREKAWRVGQYLVVMCATLFAFSIAIELAKQRGSRRGVEAALTEQCDGTHAIHPKSTRELSAKSVVPESRRPHQGDPQ